MQLLTVKEASNMMNIKDNTLYDWVAQGKIPYLKLNGCIRFDLEELKTWLKSCRKEPADVYNMAAGRRPRKGGY